MHIRVLLVNFLSLTGAAAMVQRAKAQLGKREGCSSSLGSPRSYECLTALDQLPVGDTPWQFELWPRVHPNPMRLAQFGTPRLYHIGKCWIMIKTGPVSMFPLTARNGLVDTATWTEIKDAAEEIIRLCVLAAGFGGSKDIGQEGYIGIYIFDQDSAFSSRPSDPTPAELEDDDQPNSCASSDGIPYDNTLRSDAECSISDDFTIKAYQPEKAGTSSKYCNIKNIFSCSRGYDCTPLDIQPSATTFGTKPSTMFYLGECLRSLPA
ncbi:MAG: hypothetical protein M1827_003659 [Pycnora praestabilis]|nr:MAG: hypothetical protein M1827_003659 [Pycnora praestabilis]